MSWFSRMPLSRKLGILGVVFLCCFAAFVWIARSTVIEAGVGGPSYTAIIRSKDIVADVLPPPEYIIETHLLAHQMVATTDPAVTRALITRSKKLRSEYETRHAHWLANAPPGTLRNHLVIGSYEPANDYYEVRDDEFIPAIQAGQVEVARDLLQKKLEPLYDEHRNEVDEVVKLANAAAEKEEKDAVFALNVSMWVLLGIGAGVVAMLAVSGWVVMRSMQDLVDRIAAVTKVARSVAEGDLSPVNVPSESADTKDLVEAIRTMTDSLRSLVGRVKVTSATLTQTASQLSTTSRDQDALVQTLSSSAAQTAASTRQISSISQGLLKTVDAVVELANRAVDVAESGRGGLERMHTSVDSLEKATGAVSGRLATVHERATDITGIVTTMTKVAEQTNLLSVNAAIEAEKAGEQGRGFLVVAREIRRLADQSAVASLDIEHMVRQTQGAVSSGVMEMDRFAEHVRRVNETTSGVSAQLAEVIERIKKLRERIAEVSDGMQNQSQGAVQISEAMLSIKDGTNHTAASASELRVAAGGLQQAVSSLSTEIAHFGAG